MDQETPTSSQSQNRNFNRLDYTDQIRRPDRVKRQRLSDDYDVLAEKRTKILKTEQSFSSAKARSNKTQGLSNLYRAPIELLTSGTLDEVIEIAKVSDKWLLVNIQSEQVFLSHELNRDVWSDEGVKSMIECSFIFWQHLDISPQGETFIRYYNIRNLPSVLILDPITRAVKWRSQESRLRHLPEKIQDFLGSNPSPSFQLQQTTITDNRPSINSPKVNISNEASLCDVNTRFGFNATKVLEILEGQGIAGNTETSNFGESIKIKIRLPNGHSFIRSINPDKKLIHLLKEVVNQISASSYNLPFDILFDHPQQSLFERLSSKSYCPEERAAQISVEDLGIRSNFALFVRFID